jgi:SAM-dependent methyltransferase
MVEAVAGHLECRANKRRELRMQGQQIRFQDGAAYERAMGTWSQLVGDIFLDWLMPGPDLRWIDVGCGNGAFSQLLVDRCAPEEVQGIDPSTAQLSFARTRPAAQLAQFQQGEAMALPFPDRRFDAAVMALVIFFVPEPAKGVAEMVRVVKPGGIVAAYAWDVMNDGMPQEAIRAEMREIGAEPLMPPSAEASRIERLRELSAGAGLEGVETREIVVARIFADFDDFWATSLLVANISSVIAALPAADVERIKEGARARLPPDAAGRITCTGRANAVKGRVPK